MLFSPLVLGPRDVNEHVFQTRLRELSQQSGTWRRDDTTNELYDYFEPALMANALLLRTCHRDVDVTARDRASTGTRDKCSNCKRIPCDEARKGISLGRLSVGWEDWLLLAPPALLALEEEQFEECGYDKLTESFDTAYYTGSSTAVSPV